MNLRRLGVIIALGASSACRSEARDPDVERVEFGVPFGGDIQDRPKIPLDVEPAELALRVTFREPQRRQRSLSWELERPANSRGTDGGLLFSAELGEAHVAVGESQAEAKLSLRRNDLPGPWRIRVRLDGRSLFERKFEVTEPASREKR